MAESKIDVLTLDDGRKAERHITTDPDGREVVEIFAEEKKPLKLEKRVVREMKQIVAKETHETIRDGEVVLQEIKSLEPEIPLEIRSRIATPDHNKETNPDYATREEINELLKEGIVAAVETLFSHMEPVQSQSYKPFKAQQIVEERVEENKKKKFPFEIILGIVLVAQVVAIAGYIFFA